MLKLLSADGAQGQGPFAARRPNAAVTQVHLGDEPDGAHIGAVVAGKDGASPTDADFVTAFHALDTITDVSLLADSWGPVSQLATRLGLSAAGPLMLPGNWIFE